MAHKLELSGIDRKQAKSVATAIRGGQGALVTKEALNSVMTKLENRLTLRMLGV
ncbi:MAG: hypothetical protein OXH37_11720 [Gammaproteobacteria bacterium]|nr:hypothetical protein [Gammaproteobacteria bacterium]